MGFSYTAMPSSVSKIGVVKAKEAILEALMRVSCDPRNSHSYSDSHCRSEVFLIVVSLNL